MACCTPGCVAFTRKIIWVLMLLGFVFSIVAAFSCEFIKYDHGNGIQYAGLFHYRNENGECVAYDRSMDKSEEMAKTASVIAFCAALVAMFVTTIKLCCPSCKGSRFLVNSSMLVAIISQGVTFVFYNSDELCDGDILNEILHQDPCTPGKGSAFSIMALLLFFFSALSFWCVPKSSREVAEDTEEHNVEGGGDDPSNWHKDKASGTYT